MTNPAHSEPRWYRTVERAPNQGEDIETWKPGLGIMQSVANTADDVGPFWRYLDQAAPEQREKNATPEEFELLTTLITKQEFRLCRIEKALRWVRENLTEDGF